MIRKYQIHYRPILLIYLLRQSSIVPYPISRLDRYMEQSKIYIGDRLLILGVYELNLMTE